MTKDEKSAERAAQYDGDTRESRAAFRNYDSVSEPVSNRTPWQIWRDACAWQFSALAEEAHAVPREGRGYATKDAIERAKRVMAAVDTYHARPDGGNRHALRSILMDEFEELLAAPQSVPAQPVAIYQVRVGNSWVDSNPAEYAAVSNEKRIVYTAPAAAEQVEQARDRILDQTKNSLFRSGVKIMAAEILSPTEQCDKPPEGWSCSRIKGHEGPCAAEQDVPRALTDEQMITIVRKWAKPDSEESPEFYWGDLCDCIRECLTAAGAK